MADIDYNRSATSPRPSRLPWMLVGLLCAFIGGMAGSPWFEAQVRGFLPASLRPRAPADADAALMARAAALENRVQTLEARPLGNDAADLSAKVAALEAHQQSDNSGAARVADDLGPLSQRVDTLELRLTTAEQAAHAASAAVAQLPSLQNQVLALSTAATQQAQRQRALASLPLLRRALDTGQPLDRPLTAIAPVLAPNNPDITQLRQLAPIPTLTALQNDLARLARTPEGASIPSTAAWLDTAMATVRNLVQVKRGDIGSQPTDASSPVQQAQQRLRSGDVDGAILLVRQIARTEPLRLWLQSATRFQSAHMSANRLEEAVIDASLDTTR